jgi:hypothetical protein
MKQPHRARVLRHACPDICRPAAHTGYDSDDDSSGGGGYGVEDDSEIPSWFKRLIRLGA